MVRQRSKWAVERTIREHTLELDVEKLVRGGFNRNELLSLLETVFSLTSESWGDLLGMSLRSLKKTVKQIMDCADTVALLERSELAYYVSIELGADTRLLETPKLSERLRKYANEVQHLMSIFGPTRKVKLNAWKAFVVATVIEHTAEPHDTEVAALISALTGNPRYTTKSHQQWRLGNLHRINMMAAIARKRRPKPHKPASASSVSKH